MRIGLKWPVFRYMNDIMAVYGLDGPARDAKIEELESAFGESIRIVVEGGDIVKNSPLPHLDTMSLFGSDKYLLVRRGENLSAAGWKIVKEASEYSTVIVSCHGIKPKIPKNIGAFIFSSDTKKKAPPPAIQIVRAIERKDEQEALLLWYKFSSEEDPRKLFLFVLSMLAKACGSSMKRSVLLRHEADIKSSSESKPLTIARGYILIHEMCNEVRYAF